MVPSGSELFTGFVLAGGKSGRMGRNKALLEIDGETFLGRALRILKSTCGNPPKLVLAEPSSLHVLPEEYRITVCIYDIYRSIGPLGGLHAAFDSCQTEFAVILAVDLPLVDESMLGKICQIAAEDTRSDAFVPTGANGMRQPLAAVYRARTCLPAVTKIIESGKGNAVSGFLDSVSVRGISQAEVGADDEAFFNVNFPFDYESIAGR